MSKIQFTYQRWFLRMACAEVGLPFILVIQILVAKLMDIEYSNFWYSLICTVIVLIWFVFYYKFTQRHNWFEKTATYWIQEGTVYIQKQNKVYEINKVEWLRGTTVSVFGMAKAGMLVVQTNGIKLIFVSSQPTSVESFANCELLQIFNTILEYNAALVKDNTDDFWYESKS